jgi:hypothetical protein
MQYQQNWPLIASSKGAVTVQNESGRENPARRDELD